MQKLFILCDPRWHKSLCEHVQGHRNYGRGEDENILTAATLQEANAVLQRFATGEIAAVILSSQISYIPATLPKAQASKYVQQWAEGHRVPYVVFDRTEWDSFESVEFLLRRIDQLISISFPKPGKTKSSQRIGTRQ